MLSKPHNPGIKGWTLALGIAAVLLALVDLIALQGERVASATLRLRAGASAEIEISRVGVEHLVEISTRRKVQGESRGTAVRYRIESPDGTILYENSEFAARKRRFFEFVPGEAGIYRLFIEENMNLLGYGSDTARIAVFVNDRRVLGRLLGF